MSLVRLTHDTRRLVEIPGGPIVVELLTGPPPRITLRRKRARKPFRSIEVADPAAPLLQTLMHLFPDP